MNSSLETLVKQHMLQKRSKKASCNNVSGIVPMYCQHSTLCAFRKTLPKDFRIQDYNVFQIGHWCSCRFVWPFLHSMLSHEAYRPVQKQSFVAITELIPGSLEALVDISSRVDFKDFEGLQTRGMQRDAPFLWQSFAESKMCITDWQTKDLEGPTIVVPTSHFFRQKPVHDDSKYVVVWHVLVPKELSQISMPLDDFINHKNYFWSNSMVDIAVPENVYEQTLGPEVLCAKCLSDIFCHNEEPSAPDDDNATVPVESSTRDVIPSEISIRRFLKL